MTDEEIFDEFTRQAPHLGPRFEVEKASPWLRARLDGAASAAQFQIAAAASAAPEMPEVHFDWVENDDINACAFANRGKYFIGVNAGTLIYLHTLFSRMLSHPKTLTNVGTASLENESRVPSRLIVPGGGPLHVSQLQPVIPRDPVRQFCYEFLNSQAMSFIVAHELTHLLHGHIAYMEDRLGFQSLSENHWMKGEPMPALTRQTLEMDADMGAATAQTGMTIRLSMERRDRPTNDLAKYYRTPEDAMFYFSFGISPFFRMFGDDPVPASGADIGTYPPWRVRQMIAVATATYFISQRENEQLAVSCQQQMKHAFIQVEDAYCRATGESMATGGLREAWDGAGWRHVQDNLISHWREELYDELLPFSFVELPEAGDDIFV